MANLFSSSCLIGSSPTMAVNCKHIAFSYPSITPKVMKFRCLCVVRNDGSPTQSPKGGGAAQLQVKCSFTNKVYEDHSRGIACYIDEMGEIVCEGYDEGPRTDTSCLFGHLRDDVNVIELLERSWLQLTNDSRYTTTARCSSDDSLN